SNALKPSLARRRARRSAPAGWTSFSSAARRSARGSDMRLRPRANRQSKTTDTGRRRVSAPESEKRERPFGAKTTTSPSSSNGRGDLGKIGGAIDEIARDQAHARAGLLRNDTDAVVLLLVNPAGEVERRVDQRGEHRLDIDRRRRGRAAATPPSDGHAGFAVE